MGKRPTREEVAKNPLVKEAALSIETPRPYWERCFPIPIKSDKRAKVKGFCCLSLYNFFNLNDLPKGLGSPASARES